MKIPLSQKAAPKLATAAIERDLLDNPRSLENWQVGKGIDLYEGGSNSGDVDNSESTQPWIIRAWNIDMAEKSHLKTQKDINHRCGSGR